MSPAEPTMHPRATIRDWVGLCVLALACLMYIMDLTVLHLAVPAMSADLQPSSSQLLWIIDIYGFMVAGFLITMGTLGDRIGRRRLLMIGAAAFGVASVLCAAAPTAELLIVSRALLGVAGATLAPSTLSLLFSMFHDPAQRSRAIAVWVSAFSAGSAIGPLVGGFVLEHFWWGAVFLLAIPVVVLLLVLGPIVLPEYRDPKAGRLDLPSAGMSLVAVLSIILGLKLIAQDGVDVLAVGSIVLGVVVGWAWVRRQLRLADPMIDLRLLRARAFSAALSVNFLTVFVMVGYFLFVAQYLQLVLGMSPLEAGAWSVPSAAAFILASNAVPWLHRRRGPGTIIAVGFTLTAIGLAVLATAGASPDGLVSVVVGSIIVSFGLGPVFGLTTELVVGTAPPERAGAASGISETATELGGSLGIAIMGSIGVALYRGTMLGHAPAGVPADILEAARDTLGGAVEAAAELPQALGDALLTVARDSFVTGMQVVAVLCAIMAFATAIWAYVAIRLPPAGTDPIDPHGTRQATGESHEAVSIAAMGPATISKA
ncbi:MAG: MFS transporter [Chloroflexi bacterium]|nr:MFS transporter [Chloroflexota bacterium]